MSGARTRIFLAAVSASGKRFKVATIDVHGLKTHFLRKHKGQVDKFFEWCLAEEYSSELASKYQTRFKKHRDRLFTFVDHDGVPWNNNNAENAIKSFAALRRGIDGLSTKNGIRPTLKLLSIAQTLRNKNISFLDFLRSGERSLVKYVGRVK